jgi:phage-related protein
MAQLTSPRQLPQKACERPRSYPQFAFHSPSLCHAGLTDVVNYDNGEAEMGSGRQMARKTRPISWIKAALKEFETFPEGARSICLAALTIAAEGGKADIAKPMHGMGSGAFEIALAFRGDAYRVVYGVQLADDVWVIHAFQKKSTQGIKTANRDLELIKDRLKRLKEMLR